jgi:hypothetical protein
VKESSDPKMSVSTVASEEDFDDNNATTDPIDDSKHSAAISSRKKESHYNRSKYNSSSTVFFQICQSCFWCASNLSKGGMMERCPSCKTETLEPMPIRSDEETFYFQYDRKRGVSLEFLTA